MKGKRRGQDWTEGTVSDVTKSLNAVGSSGGECSLEESCDRWQ